ncbi:MAG TPA: hypothetical protein VGL61_07390 [Kofleriaceae bacterium]|jgi:hypothetical protein
MSGRSIRELGRGVVYEARHRHALAPNVNEPVEALLATVRYPTAEAFLAALGSRVPFGTKLEISLM